jgi:hypothetical protein
VTRGSGHGRSGRSALVGATLGLALIWFAVVGFHLWSRNWGDAAFWAAIGIATTVGAGTGLLTRKRP